MHCQECVQETGGQGLFSVSLRKKKERKRETGILKTTLWNLVIQGGQEVGQQLRGALGSLNKQCACMMGI